MRLTRVGATFGSCAARASAGLTARVNLFIKELMMNRSIRRGALAIAMCAGLAMSAWAQQSDGQNDRRQDRTTGQVRAIGVADDFRSCHTLKGQDVIGTDNSAIGDLHDLMIDRGSGRVEYALVTTGTTLGMGGKTVAVPFSSLRWDGAQEKLTYSGTADSLKQLPEWTEKDWTSMVSTSRPADTQTGTRSDPNSGSTIGFSDYYYTREQNRDSYWDPYATNIDTTSSTQVTGEVKKVERRRVGESGEQVVLTVEGSNGETRRVVMGPSWYVSGSRHLPRRGDRVTIDTHSMRRNGDGDLVATNYRLNDQDVSLRKETSGAWANRHFESNGRWYSQPYYRHVLASELRGAKTECRSIGCGSVDDVIVNMGANRVEFLSIDPDRNFLGIADTKYLVPWPVVSVGVDKTVRVDTTKEMMLAGHKTPSDLKELRNSEYTDTIYRAYDVTPTPQWDERGDGGRMGSPGADQHERRPGEKR